MVANLTNVKDPSVTVTIQTQIKHITSMHPYTKEVARSAVDGMGCIIHKTSFGWRFLGEEKELAHLMESKRQQIFSREFRLNTDSQRPFINEPKSLPLSSKPISLGTDSIGSTDSGSFIGNDILLATCIPCYDEEWCEMSGTLRSLSKNIAFHRSSYGTPNIHVVVFIIQDGWRSCSRSLKKGIENELGMPKSGFIESMVTGGSNGRVVIISPDAECYYPAGNDLESGGTTFHPIFITKSKNCQKWNSHLIFFSLCNLLNPQAVFLTDCGTLYNDNCLYLLIDNLTANKNRLVGVTARQRVMRATAIREVQTYPSWCSNHTSHSIFSSFFQSIRWWMSPAPLQGFEFESTFLLNTAMYNSMSALPVLPGPCQLLWWDHLRKRHTGQRQRVLDLYFDQMNMDVNDSNIVYASTLLAEDRILSLAMILRTSGLGTEYISGATFSYEPMMTWVQLLGQRRRWMNGTTACFLWLQDEVYRGAKLSSRPVFLTKIWNMNLYQSLVQVLSPAFFCTAVFEATKKVDHDYPKLTEFYSNYKSTLFNLEIYQITPFVYFCVYLLWVLIAISFGKRPIWISKGFYNFFMEGIYWMFSIVNCFFCSLILWNVLSSAIDSNHDSSNLGFVFYVMIVVWVIPFVIACTQSLTSAWLYFCYLIPFSIQLAMYVAFIPAFGNARLHDFSWGNRDSDGLSDKGVQARKEREFFYFNIKCNVLSVVTNFAVVCFYSFLAKNGTPPAGLPHFSIPYLFFFSFSKFNIFLTIVTILTAFLVFSPMVIQVLFALFFVINSCSRPISQTQRTMQINSSPTPFPVRNIPSNREALLINNSNTNISRSEAFSSPYLNRNSQLVFGAKNLNQP